MQAVNVLNFKIEKKIMSKKNKVFIVMFLCFGLIFTITRIAIGYFFNIPSIYGSVISAIAATVLSPQFKVFKTNQGEKVYMRWLFNKKVKELNW